MLFCINMKWTIIVLVLLIIDITLASGLFDSNGYLNPGSRATVVLGDNIWDNFQTPQLPGLHINGDKFDKDLIAHEPLLSGVEVHINESSFDSQLQLKDSKIELKELEDEQNPTSPASNVGTTLYANNESISINENLGENPSKSKPNTLRESATTILPRWNGTVDINVVTDVPDKNFIDWILNPFTTTTTTPTSVKPEECPQCQCGLSSPPNRIVGGVEARIFNYPWVVYLTYNGKFYCAASIISDRYLLTAAHCVDRFNKNQMRAVIGAHNRNKTSAAQTITYKVADIIKHSGYSMTNYNNDIALIKIDGRIKFVGPIRPVCLSNRGPTYAGRDGIVTGWGAIMESGSTADVLHEVVVPIMTNAACRATKYPAKKITENMMCAGYPEGGKDSCQGDSGGPLHVLDGKTYKVVGIVSWGEGCAARGYPGVYARVNRYITWIELKTKDSCYCSRNN